MSRVRQVRPLASEPAQGRVDSPYLSTEEAASYLRYASARSLYNAVTRLHIPHRRCGRKLLFRCDELDRWLAGESRVTLLREARSTPIAVLRHAEQSDPSCSPSQAKGVR